MLRNDDATLSSDSPDQLHNQALNIVRGFKRVESSLLDILQRIDGQKAFLALGYPSLFEYAVQALDLTEAVAFSFIRVARKAKEIPEMKEQIQSGRLTVAKASRIASVINSTNKMEWINKAVEMPKQDLEREIIRIVPELEKRETLRRVSENTFRLHLGLKSEIVEKLKRAQNLEASRVHKNLNLEETLERVLDDYLKRRDPLLKNSNSTPGGSDQMQRQADERRIQKNVISQLSSLQNNLEKNTPAASSLVQRGVNLTSASVRDGLTTSDELCPGRVVSIYGSPRKNSGLSSSLRNAVLRRDQGRCQYVNNNSKKCRSSRFIEVHHRVPVSEGGLDVIENLITLCWSHHHWWHLQYAGRAPR